MAISGLPTVVSRKKKLPIPDAAPMDVTVPSKGPELLVSNSIVPDEDARFAVPLKVVTTLLNGSLTSTLT